MYVSRTSATKLRWTVTAGLLAAAAIAGVLVGMCSSTSHGAVTPTGVVEAR
jgi:hypothetical protein